MRTSRNFAAQIHVPHNVLQSGQIANFNFSVSLSVEIEKFRRRFDDETLSFSVMSPPELDCWLPWIQIPNVANGFPSPGINFCHGVSCPVSAVVPFRFQRGVSSRIRERRCSRFDMFLSDRERCYHVRSRILLNDEIMVQFLCMSQRIIQVFYVTIFS